MADYAENSQALRDLQRASADLRQAITANAPTETITELATARAAAEERVLSLRRRAS